MDALLRIAATVAGRILRAGLIAGAEAALAAARVELDAAVPGNNESVVRGR